MPVIMKDNVQYAYTDKGIKAHTLSYAEYQALSAEEKMNGDLYFIPDKQPEGNPSLIWDKLGTATLDTDADNVSDAVNELNSSLANMLHILNRGASSNLNNIPTIAGSVSIVTFVSSTLNIPVSGSGYCLTFLNSDSAIYGRQVVVMNNGLYSRRLQNGSWQAWQIVSMSNIQ